jgi:hypothetical protein
MDPTTPAHYSGAMRATPRHRSSLLAGIASAGLAACAASSEHGTSVELVSAPSATDAGQEVPAGSGRLSIDELAWTVSEIELLACPSAWQRAAEWLLPTAHAHGTSTPTILAVPTVERALRHSDTVLGRLSPPAGRYCGVRYRLGPADADAEGLEQLPEMLGRSVLLRGSFGALAGELEGFELDSQLALAVELPIDFELSESERALSLRFERDGAVLFQDVDFGVLDGVRRELAVLEALQASLAVRLQ